MHNSFGSVLPANCLYVYRWLLTEFLDTFAQLYISCYGHTAYYYRYCESWEKALGDTVYDAERPLLKVTDVILALYLEFLEEKNPRIVSSSRSPDVGFVFTKY